MADSGVLGVFSYSDMEKARLALEGIASGNRLITVVTKYGRVGRQSPSSLKEYNQKNRLNGHWDNSYSIDDLYDLSQEYMSKNPGKKFRSQN